MHCSFTETKNCRIVIVELPKKIVIICPHPDDETIAMGGSIARLVANGSEVSLLTVSGHLPPLYKKNHFEITKKEALDAYQELGIKDYEFAKIPATFVHQEPVSKLNSLISNFINKRNPDAVFIPFPDRHIDHRTIFDSSVVACRPILKNSPKLVLAYETLSETHWNVPGIEASFVPNYFIDISKFINKKVEALLKYKSQLTGNDSRSCDACEALARFRGSQNGCKYAEAYKLVRFVI